MSTSFARDYHMHGEIAATKDGKILGLRVKRAGRPRRVQRRGPADQIPGRVLPHLHRLLRPPGRALRGHRRLHQQGARRGRLRLLVPDHRGRLPGRADGRLLAFELDDGPGRAADEEPAAARAVPVHLPDRLGVRLRRLPARAAGGAWTWPATPSCAGSRRRRRERGELMGIGLSFFTEASARARASTWTSSAWAWPTAPSCGCTRPARPCCASPCQTQGQGHETTFAQIVAAGARHPAGRHRGRARRHRPDAVRAGHLRVPVHAGVRRGRRRRGRARCGTRPGSSPRPCSRSRRTTWSGSTAAGR